MKSFLVIFGLCGLLSGAMGHDAARAARQEALRGVRGAYSHPPRLANGRVDVSLLIVQLIEIHANTYSFAIHQSSNDWDDLQLFLPRAREHGLRAWASIVPPTESPPKGKLYAEPFRLDYDRWAVEFARLSVRETNLAAWSIDDFTYNTKTTFTPEHLKKMLDAARAINPRLAFVPCCYFKPVTAEFAKTYAPLVDGILFPYRHESGGANLKDADLVDSEVNKLKALTGPGFPIVVDIYATAHSRLGKSTPEYVREAMNGARTSADGVMIYCHQDPLLEAEKYQIIKERFGTWTQ